MKIELIDKYEVYRKMYLFIVEGSREKDTSKDKHDAKFLENRWSHELLEIIQSAPVIEIKED
jgi:hypothetical protein